MAREKEDGKGRIQRVRGIGRGLRIPMAVWLLAIQESLPYLRVPVVIAGATHSIALFLESFPHTLAAWLRSRLTQEPNDVEVLRKTETALTEILRFMSDEGVLHLDAHFENILTDGERLYLGDFGLALSRSFELQPDEFAFFERHANFDRCTVVTSLVHAIVAQYDARFDWRQSLRELLVRSHPASDRLPAELRSYLEQRVPVALAIGDFYRRLLNDLTIDYPATELQMLLDDLKV
jgi:tRNA A-37 threonylcarbamoyl transferase component Bud32